MVQPQRIFATPADISEFQITPIDEQAFGLLGSLSTDTLSTGVSNTVFNSSDNILFESMGFFDPTLHDWFFTNNLTQGLLLDMVISRTSLRENQVGLTVGSLSAARTSHESALSFLSELSVFKLSGLGDLTAFLKQYTVDDSDLELDLGTSLGTDGDSTESSVLYRLFTLLVFLISNNVLASNDVRRIFVWAVANNCTWMIMDILELSSTTVEIFAAKIFTAAVQAGEIELVRKLISRGIDVNSPISTSFSGKSPTALSLAVESRDLKMVEFLCALGATLEVTEMPSLKTKNGSLWSSRNKEILSFLLARGANPETFISDKPRGFPLISAASEGEIEAVQLLLDAGAQPDRDNLMFGTALQAAAARGHEAVVQTLIEHGANVNTTCITSNHHHSSEERWIREHECYKTPIQLAASGNHMGIVQTLLQSGALVNYSPIIAYLGLPKIDDLFSNWSRHTSPEGIPLAYAIQYATLNQNVTLTRQLLAAGANIDSRIGINYGDTPLQIAARLGNVAMTRLLLDYKANVNAPPAKYRGRTAIQAASECGNIEIIKILLCENADINAPAGWQMGRTAVQAALERRHQHAATILLESGADISAVPAFCDGVTALQAAALTGDIEIFQLALRNGPDINAAAGPENGLTALQAVIKHMDLTALKIALLAGADVNGRPSKSSDQFWDSDGCRMSNQTPLQYAASLEWFDGVQFLLDWGADIDALPPHATYFNACSALGRAADNRDEDIIKLLLCQGANPNAPALNHTGAPSAFIYALSQGCSREIIELFLQKGADITSCWGTRSALETAASGSEADVVRMIMNLMSELPRDDYHNAIKRSLAFVPVDFDWVPDHNIVEMLVHAGADVNVIHSQPRKPFLLMCIASGSIDIIKFLLENGAEVNIPATDDTGTPLQTAILYEEVEIAHLLIEHGADINAPPSRKRGATALQAAAIHGYYRLVLRLLEDGADVAAWPSEVSGRTAIDGAAEHGRLDILQLLLNAYGSRPDLAFVCNHAASLAEREGHIRIANWLRTYKPS